MRGLLKCPTYIFYREPDLILVEVRLGVSRKLNLGHPPADRRFWAFKAAAVWTPSLKRDCYPWVAVPFHAFADKLMQIRAQIDGYLIDMGNLRILRHFIYRSFYRAVHDFDIIQHLPHLAANSFQIDFPQVL